MKGTADHVMSAMHYARSILEEMGNTPLVRLNRIASNVSPLVLAKLEFFNPGGSIKDRIGPALIDYCEQQGWLHPGGTIVEPTSGNTGHGLAIAAAIKGYRCIFVVTDKVSEEKRNLLRAYGAEVVICPSNVAHDSPNYYQNVAHQLAEIIPGACCPNQYSNPANPAAHYATTGPEIWRDTAGQVTTLVAGIGTGGTITGTARYLKEQNPNIRVIGVDPVGSVYSGNVSKPYKVEGIGADILPQNYDSSLVDDMICIDDCTSFSWSRRLAREEGILVGGSAGAAVAAALTYARRLTSNDVVVVILPDTGRSYLTKHFNDTWMRENDLQALPENEHATLLDVLDYRRCHSRRPLVISVCPTTSIADAIELLRCYGIGQAPVMEDGQMIGSFTQDQLLCSLVGGECTVGEIHGPPFLALEATAFMCEAEILLTTNYQTAIAILNKGMLEGIVTKSDLVKFRESSGRRVSKNNGCAAP